MSWRGVARRLVIRNRGRARPDALLKASDNPARGKAQGRIVSAAESRFGNGPQTGVEAQKSTATLIPGRSLFCRSRDFHQAIGHPDENQSGRTRDVNDTWARTGRNAVGN